MSSKPEQIIHLASSWVTEIKGLSTKNRVTWNKLLKICFEDELPKEQILLVAFQNHKIQSLDDYTHEELVKAMALLLLYKKGLSKEKDPLAERLVQNKLDQVLRKVDPEEKELEKEIHRYEALNNTYSTRTVIQLPATIMPLLIDHILRWAVLWFFINENLALIWITNFLILPTVLIPLFYLRQRQISKKNRLLIEQYLPGRKIKKAQHFRADQWTLIFLITIVSVVISYTLKTDYFIAIITIAAYGLYYGAYIRVWSEKKLKEEDLVEQLDEDFFNPEALTAEKNDEVIIERSVALKSISNRLEAYVLESALFGALAFSGFLQIMAENLISFEDLAAFGSHLFGAFKSIVYLDEKELYSTLLLLSSKKDLFSLVSLETLLCSVFFLVVIASRLRFTDKADKVEESLELAKALNVKEELLLQAGRTTSDDLVKKYNRQIADFLIKGNNDLNEIKPVLTYMRFFRNAGILTFFVVLISSALFISSFISWLIAMIALSGYAFFNRKELKNTLENIAYALRSLFIRKGYYFLLAAVILFLAGLFLRVEAHWLRTDIFIFSGLILFGLYLFTWIVFIPHVDKKFVPVNHEQLNSSWWFFIRVVWGVALFLGVLAYLFDLINISGSNEIMMLGTTMLLFIIMVTGFYLVNPRWLGIISSIILSVITLGFMFKFLHLPGASEISFLGLLLLSIFLLAVNFVKIKNKWWAVIRTAGPFLLILGTSFKVAHDPRANTLLLIGLILSILTLISYSYYKVEQRIYHRIYIFNGIFLVLISSALSVNRIVSGQIAYQNYTFDSIQLQSINQLRKERNKLFSSYVAGIKDPSEDFPIFFKGHLSNVDQYLSYSRTLPPTIDEKMLVEHYYSIALRVFHDKENATVEDLEVAYELTKRANLIGQKIGYPRELFVDNEIKRNDDPPYLPMLELRFLELLGKKDETHLAAQRFLEQEHTNYPEMKIELARYLKDN